MRGYAAVLILEFLNFLKSLLICYIILPFPFHGLAVAISLYKLNANLFLLSEIFAAGTEVKVQ
jgi:hypothetical protein